MEDVVLPSSTTSTQYGLRPSKFPPEICGSVRTQPTVRLTSWVSDRNRPEGDLLGPPLGGRAGGSHDWVSDGNTPRGVGDELVSRLSPEPRSRRLPSGSTGSPIWGVTCWRACRANSAGGPNSKSPKWPSQPIRRRR